MFVRMIIGEAISDAQVREFTAVYHASVLPELLTQPGFLKSSLIEEEDGRMVVSMTAWQTRDDCLRYHSSRAYRKFVSLTQHLLVGHFVVKLFRDTTPTTPEPLIGWQPMSSLPLEIKRVKSAILTLVAALGGRGAAVLPDDDAYAIINILDGPLKEPRS